jgi:hypothetical protein
VTSYWASAIASQIRRQVLNLCRGDQIFSISGDAFREASGLVYVSYPDGAGLVVMPHDSGPGRGRSASEAPALNEPLA